MKPFTKYCLFPFSFATMLITTATALAWQTPVGPAPAPIFDDQDVGYSKDGKILTGCKFTFNETRYEVPHGVEEIDDCAFLSCRHYLELSVPGTVRVIGDSIFGNGGQIVIRD